MRWVSVSLASQTQLWEISWLWGHLRACNFFSSCSFVRILLSSHLKRVCASPPLHFVVFIGGSGTLQPQQLHLPGEHRDCITSKVHLLTLWVWVLSFRSMTHHSLATFNRRKKRLSGPPACLGLVLYLHIQREMASAFGNESISLIWRHWDREHSKVKGVGLPAQERVSGVRRSGPLFKWHSVCWGMCNYGGQAFDPGFPSGLNCPHIERCSVSLGTPLYSAALSCAPLWNSKHPLLKSELWPVHAPVRDQTGRRAQ